MYTQAILTVALATLSLAAPTKRQEEPYHGVSLAIKTNYGLEQPGVYEPAPVEINKLTSLGDENGVSASEIKFDGVSSNVDINSVECRAFKDKAGVQPGSAPFTLASPAELSTNLVTVSSVLCYVRTVAEY